jgi:FtsZ-binding cell division protein ZapB
MNKEQILNTTNFRDYTQNQLIEMIRLLQMEVKTMRHSRDFEIENLRHQILTLNSRCEHQAAEVEKLKTTTQRYLKMLEKPLTLKERLSGKKKV